MGVSFHKFEEVMKMGLNPTTVRPAPTATDTAIMYTSRSMGAQGCGVRPYGNLVQALYWHHPHRL